MPLRGRDKSRVGRVEAGQDVALVVEGSCRQGASSGHNASSGQTR